jgi:serine/threonine protein kinase/tetratricopeptide (TPR) repeat protein
MSTQKTIANRYHIKTELGQGGMGTVYLATDTQTSTSVAVKQLKADIAQPELIERFKREGEALRDLNHPNIVKLLDMLEENGEHYLVMDYVRGGDLSDLLQQGKIELEQILRYTLDLADALTRAHKLNIIHRDLKPANILLADDGTLRLTDFGIARLGSKNRVTETDAIIGTIDYLPPEAFDGSGIDTRADIWAFGVILFEMIAGERPFTAENIMEMIHQITTQAIPDLEALNPDAPVELVDLVYRMLERDPQSRMASVRHVGAILEDILHGRTAQSNSTKRFDTPPPEVQHQNRHNLPAQTTPFVGRESEIDALVKLINDPANRLITVLAPGGMGKTRLSLEVAEQYLSPPQPIPDASRRGYADGVFFVELAPLSDIDNILTAIADALEYHFQGDGRDPLQQITDYLSSKTLLLVLDNFEHLLDGAGLVTDILKTAPTVNILATSRQRLNQMGETLYHLSGMDFPAWETPADAITYGSVQLFLQSAKRVQPDFELTTDNLHDVARICKLVQGMPLGILLSASWLGMLTASEVAEEIAGGIDFFETDEIGLPDRQRSIRVVFDYSWDSMTSIEQDVFMRLSVFRGGFTRESAQAVTGANLRILMSLNNKSLIRRNADTGRYEIHELLRQYSHEKLIEQGVEDETRDKHSDHFVAFLEQYSADELTVKTNDKIEIEFENIRIAMRHCADFSKSESILSVHQVLGSYLDNRARHQDAMSLMGYMIDTLSIATDANLTVKKTISRLQGELAVFYNAVGRGLEGIVYASSALEIAKSLDDDVAINWAYHSLNLCNWMLGEFTNMLETATEATHYFEAKGLLHQYPVGLSYTTIAHLHFGNLQQAKETGLKLVQMKDSSLGGGGFLQAMIFEALEDYDRAREYYLEGLQRFEEANDTWGIAISQMLFGHFEVKQNNHTEAEIHFHKAFLVEYPRNNFIDMYVIMMGISSFLAMRGDSEFAVRLASFLFHYDISIKSYVGEPVVRPQLDQTLDNLKIEMGEEAYQQAWKTGKSLTFDAVKQELFDYFNAMPEVKE